VQVIKGLRDGAKRGQVSFALRTTKDCTVKMAMETIKDAYREVGEPDPFAPGGHVKAKLDIEHTRPSIPSLSGLHRVLRYIRCERIPASDGAPANVGRYGWHWRELHKNCCSRRCGNFTATSSRSSDTGT
jgi:hypothetical protein